MFGLIKNVIVSDLCDLLHANEYENVNMIHRTNCTSSNHTNLLQPKYKLQKKSLNKKVFISIVKYTRRNI